MFARLHAHSWRHHMTLQSMAAHTPRASTSKPCRWSIYCHLSHRLVSCYPCRSQLLSRIYHLWPAFQLDGLLLPFFHFPCYLYDLRLSDTGDIPKQMNLQQTCSAFEAHMYSHITPRHRLACTIFIQDSILTQAYS